MAPFQDLATPAAALSLGTGAAANQTAAAAGGQSRPKKKKGPRGAKPIDSSVLGFKPAGDPNRMNAGAIDLEGI